MKSLAIAFFLIWFAAAVVATGSSVLSDRGACIADRGLLEGLLGCEEGPVTWPDRGRYWMTQVIHGAAWPRDLFEFLTRHQPAAGGAAAASTERAPDSASVQKAVSEKEGYLCGQMLSDVKNARSDDKDAKRSLKDHFEDEIFAGNDNRNMRRLLLIATDYYGRSPYPVELKDFTEKSLQLAVPACLAMPDMRVVDALFVGANAALIIGSGPIVPGKS